MSSVSVSYLEDKGKQNSEEKKGIIQQDIDHILKASVGDSCNLSNYDAFYGDKVGFLPHGPGIMRMNDQIVIQSTWKNGVVDGELLIFDVVAKRLLAYMDVADGVITFTQFLGAGGYTITLSFDNYRVTYCHCSPNYIVKVGDTVKQGQVIGHVGPKYVDGVKGNQYSDSSGRPTNGATTGTHLHFGIRIDGKYQNPLDFFI